IHARDSRPESRATDGMIPEPEDLARPEGLLARAHHEDLPIPEKRRWMEIRTCGTFFGNFALRSVRFARAPRFPCHEGQVRVWIMARRPRAGVYSWAIRRSVDEREASSRECREIEVRSPFRARRDPLDPRRRLHVPRPRQRHRDDDRPEV